MGKLADLAAQKAQQRRNQNVRCPVARIIRELTPSQRQDLADILGVLPDEAVASALCDSGFNINKTQLGSHRRGDCSCVDG